jgi:hypothetical protein
MKVELTPAEFHDLMIALAIGFADHESRQAMTRAVAESVIRELGKKEKDP